MMKKISNIEKTAYIHIINNGTKTTELSFKKINILKQDWRKIYSIKLKSEKGVWRYNKYDWHVFSWQMTNSISGHKAVIKVLNIKQKEWYIWGDRDSRFGLIVNGVTPINLCNTYEDFILTSIDFNWTVAFTHESNCGPYYSDKKIIAQQGDAPEPAIIAFPASQTPQRPAR